jgi:uncharacterized protein YbaP (TraB family)
MMTTGLATSAPSLIKRAQDCALWLIAAVHVMAAASLLVILASLTPAHAEDNAAKAAVCTGKNLLEELKTSNPKAYQAVLAKGAKIPNGENIFWKIEKPGIEASYLLGTMHVSDPRVLKMPAGAPEALKAAKTIVIESDEILDDKKAMAGLLSNPDLTMFTDGTSIDKLLSKDDEQRLEAVLKSRGVPFSAVSRMKPWMLMSFLSLPACEMARKADNTAFLDKQIALDAVAAGKPVKGLETFQEQLSTLAEIPMDTHIKSLIGTLKMGDKMDDVFETMTDLYVSGQIGLTVPMLKAVDPESDDTGYGDFEQLVVTQRNHRMAERVAPILGQGGALIAVGALHLPGKEGLVELLRSQGYTVTPAG